jgi:HAD superfamily hydrolase (TIGR01549 family)
MTVDEIFGKIRKEGIKTVIFDFDNTICDMVIDWNEWDQKVGELMQYYEPNVPLTGGYMRDNHINSFIKKHGSEFREKWKDLSKTYEKEKSHGCKPLTRIVELIHKLNGNVNLLIWSSNSEETVKKYLKEIGIETYFSKLITRDSVDFIKPDPSGFNKNITSDTNLSEYMMIGNSNNDRMAAKSAGIQYVDVKEIS